MLPIALSHVPAGASVKQLVHYAQLKRAKNKFRQYDYGYIKNLEYYGTSEPPNYNLKQITTSIIFHYSKNDWVTGWESVEKLFYELSNAKFKIRYLVPDSNFNHLDFVWAKDARKLLYNRVVKLLRIFKNK